jgi:hypothetical protein
MTAALLLICKRPGAGALMTAYLPALLVALTPLIAGVRALVRGRRQGIPAILRTLARCRRFSWPVGCLQRVGHHG